MLKRILFCLFFSHFIPQGMYVDTDAITVYSLNFDYHLYEEGDSETDYWGLGLSTVLKGKNEYGLNYEKKEASESIEALYNYYIKPDFYIKMKSGISYKFVKNYHENILNKEYSVRLSLYGNNTKKTKNNGLKFYPIFSYEYFFINKNQEYDLFRIGLSILFNDIGIEPSFSYISKDVIDISVKLYLWEFSSY